MSLLGCKEKSWVQCLSGAITCLGAIVVLLAGPGCIGTQNVRKAKSIPVKAPDSVEIVEVESPVSDQAEEEASAENENLPSSADGDIPGGEIIAAVARGEGGVAEALQQTRGAVFASLTTPAGEGPPASAVKTSEADPGFQDSATQLTGAEPVPSEPLSGEVENAADISATPEEITQSEETQVSQDEAESSITEIATNPAPETPEEPVEIAVSEAAKVEPPPETEPPILTQPIIKEPLVTQNMAGSGVEDGTQSNTASVLFIILGGVGAALILLRRRVKA